MENKQKRPPEEYDKFLIGGVHRVTDAVQTVIFERISPLTVGVAAGFGTLAVSKIVFNNNKGIKETLFTHLIGGTVQPRR